MPVMINTNVSGADFSGMTRGYVSPSLVEQSASNPVISQEKMDAVSMEMFNRVSGQNAGVSAWEHIGRFSGGVLTDLADTMWASPLNPAGDRGDVWALTSPEQREYYNNNKGIIEGSSAVLGGVLTAVAAEALIIPKLTASLASSTAITSSRLWSASKSWNEGTRLAMLTAQRTAAEAGEAYSLFGSSAGRAFVANRAVSGVALTTRTMPAEYALMWNNEAFNSGEWGKEGFWLGAAVALGGSLGVMGARGAARTVSNSQEIRDMRAAPLAMSGVSNDLLNPSSLDISTRIVAAQAQLKESAYTTEFLLASRSANPNRYDESAANASRLNSLRDSYQDLAVDSTQKIINAGISGVTTLKGAMKKSPESVHLVAEVAKTDPFVLHGLAEMGLPTVALDQVKPARELHIKNMEKEVERLNKAEMFKEAQATARKARVLKQQEPFAMVNGQWMDIDSDIAKAAAKFDPNKVVVDTIQVKGTEGVKLTMPVGGNLYLDGSLTPVNGAGHNIKVEKMDIRDRLHLTAAGGEMIKKMTRKDAKVQFNLTPTAAESWFSLDMAAEVLRQGGKIQYDKTLKGIQTLDDIERQSLRIKAKAVLAEIGPQGRIDADIRFKYNLPQSTSMEAIEDSAGDGFRMWLNAAAEEGKTTRELRLALDDYRQVSGVDLLPPAGNPIGRVDGEMFSFNRGKKGDWLRPMVGYFDPKSQIEKISQRGHSNALTMAVAERTAILNTGDTHVNTLSRNLTQSPDMPIAMDVKGFSNDQTTGMGGGIGQAVGEFLPNRFKDRDHIQNLAASKLQEQTERHGRAVFADLMEKAGMQAVVTRITSSGHAAQRAMLDEYFSLRPGWDLDEAVDLGEGMFGFKLKDTESNRFRLGMSKEEGWTDALMPNERLGKPIAVDSTAMEAITAYNGLTGELIKADNTLRAANGLKPVDFKPFFAPVQDTKNAFVGFVFGPDDKLIPGKTIVAKSQAEYDSLYKRTLEEFGKGSGHSIRTKGHLEKLRSVYDEAQLDWIDPGISAAQSAMGSQKGGLTGAYTRQGAFNEALEWVQRKTMAQSQDTLRNLMKEPLLVAKANSVAERALAGNSKPTRNIYDVYEQRLTGNSQSFAETSILDGGIRKVEQHLDRMLASSAVSIPARHIVDLAQRIGMNPSDLNGKKTFRQIADSMGPYTPFANATEYLESRGIRQPPTVKGMATALNSMAASVFLRWFELPHALMNGLGLIATMPAAVLGNKAPISSFVNVSGQSIGIVDGTRIMANGMKRMFAKRAGQDWEHMLKNGDATQSVIEYHQQLGSIQSQAGFMKVMKKADKYASIVSETSESWSRQTAHFIGLELADHNGIVGLEARHNYAREIANSMIADYAPINRPELFGSGFGSLVGLFQSYGLNHYTKMYRWMENGDYKLAGIQAAVQATMFGMPGTYGLGGLMDLRDSLTATGSEPTALDMIYSRFGPVLGGAIAHGSVSELTQLALWTRGDMNPRIPGASGSLPALEVGNKVANGFIDGVKSFMSAMPGEGTNALMEVVSREMPNRILKSWLILANGGKEIDAYGQVMTETRTWMDTAARSLGLRSRRQQAELEAFYAGKGAMDRDAAKMESLRKSFRAAVRNNKGNPENVNPVQYFNKYLEAGGNPRAFKTWTRNLLRDSNDARSMETLKKSLETPRSALEVWRFGAYGAWAVD